MGLSSSSLSLVIERGLRALLCAEVVPLQLLESDALELLCTLSFTSGTKSLPSIPGGRRARSRLVGDWEMDVGDVGVAVEGWKEVRESDLCWND